MLPSRRPSFEDLLHTLARCSFPKQHSQQHCHVETRAARDQSCPLGIAHMEKP
jgi:hypothetical protein